MQLFSPPKTRLTFFSACHSPNSYSCTSPHPNPNFSHSFVKVPINVLASLLLLKSSCFSSKVSLASPLEEQIICSESEARAGEERDEEGEADENVVLSVRRPVKEGLDEVDDSWGSGNENVGVFEYASKLKIDQGISEFVKKMPMFEPERGVALEDKPLGINLELGLYRAKVLARNFQFKEAEQILQKCIMLWPEDGRPYVALGKLLCKQSKFAEARAIYERGSQATEGENPYIWQIQN